MATSSFPSVVTGVTVQTATSGALSGDGSSGNKLAVSVDNDTITVNGSNQLVASGGGGGTPGGSTTQVQYNNAGAFGGSANLTYADGLLSVLNGGVTGLVPRDYNEAAIITSDVTDDNVIGAYVLARMASTGATNLFAEGMEADAVVTATTTEGAVGFSTQLSADGAITVGHLWGVYIYAPSILNGATVTSEFGIWLDALGGTATNTYSFWSDEDGVFRIKSDNTFNSVYQAIPALYNPQFTKYTPGAANYERIVFQWESNVAVLTTEKGGTGTLRALRIGDTGVDTSFGGQITKPGGTLIVTNTALTDGAAAAVGTLTNAPASGNPTKWIPVNDNGTTRYIPAW